MKHRKTPFSPPPGRVWIILFRGCSGITGNAGKCARGAFRRGGSPNRVIAAAARRRDNHLWVSFVNKPPGSDLRRNDDPAGAGRAVPAGDRASSGRGCGADDHKGLSLCPKTRINRDAPGLPPGGSFSGPPHGSRTARLWSPSGAGRGRRYSMVGIDICDPDCRSPINSVRRAAILKRAFALIEKSASRRKKRAGGGRIPP